MVLGARKILALSPRLSSFLCRVFSKCIRSWTFTSPPFPAPDIPHSFFPVCFNQQSVIINPGPSNLQPVAGKLYVPRQFCPLDAAGKDIFEEAIKSALGGTVEFVDCWDLYHRKLGEVHCGSSVKHAVLGINWWENQP
jgi:hypothetical protein